MRDGVIDSIDFLQTPGQPYPTPPHEAFEAFNGITANQEFYEDAWGKVITGYAPIKDSDANVVAVLAIDMQPKTLNKMTADSFAPFYVFALFFGSFFIVRLIAYVAKK